jgi:hypothetical protein
MHTFNVKSSERYVIPSLLVLRDISFPRECLLNFQARRHPPSERVLSSLPDHFYSTNFEHKTMCYSHNRKDDDTVGICPILSFDTCQVNNTL